MIKRIKTNGSARVSGQKRPIDLPLKASIGDGDVVMIDSSTDGSYAATKQTLAKEVADLILSQNQSLVGTFIHSYKSLDNLRDQEGKRMVIKMDSSQYLKSELSTEANDFINRTIRSYGLIIGTPEWDSKLQEFATADYWKNRNVSFYEGYYWQDLGDKWATQNINQPLKNYNYYNRIGFIEAYSFKKSQFDGFINKLNSHVHSVGYRGYNVPINAGWQWYLTSGQQQPANIRTGNAALPTEGISTPVDSSNNPINFDADSPFPRTNDTTPAGTPCLLYMIVSKYWTNISASSGSGGGISLPIEISDVNGLQTALDGKATTIHNHLIGDLKFDSATSLESWLALTYAPISHSHNISAINGLQSALDGKADTTALADCFKKGETYNFDAGTPALILTDTANSSTTTLLGKGFTINRNTRTLEVDEAKIIFKDGTFQKFSINSFNANFTYKATSTSPNYVWKVDSRQIEDDILSSAYADNTIMLKKDIINPALVSIPVLATTIADGVIVNLNLGTPVLLSGDGVISDYISVASNIIKTTSTSKRIVSFSAGILGNYSAPNGNRSYRLLVRRPAVVSVVGTNANDILNENTDAKLTTSNIADSEFNFSPTFTNGITDPFNVDGFVVSLDNISGLSITTITSRVGYAKQSYIRIIFN